MRKALIPALVIVLVSVVLGGTVFREDVADAAANLNVFVTNDAANPVPVHDQGFGTQLLLNEEFVADQQATFDVAAYKNVRVSMALRNGSCQSPAFLDVFESGTTPIARLTPFQPCLGGIATTVIEVPGRRMTVSLRDAPPGERWLVAVFGRAN